MAGGVVGHVRARVVGDPGSRHPRRPVDPLGQQPDVGRLERVLRRALDEGRQVAAGRVDGVVVEVFGLRRGDHRERGERAEQVAGGRVALVEAGDRRRLADPARHPQQVAHAERRGQLRGRRPEVGPDLAHRLVPGERTVVDEAGDQRRAHRLRRRGDEEVRLRRHRPAAGHVPNPEPALEPDSAPVDERDGRPDDAKGRERRRNVGLELRQRGVGKTGAGAHRRGDRRRGRRRLGGNGPHAGGGDGEAAPAPLQQATTGQVTLGTHGRHSSSRPVGPRWSRRPHQTLAAARPPRPAYTRGPQPRWPPQP